MDIKGFIGYMDKLRPSTEALIKIAPADKIDWKPMEGNFLTLGQVLDHLTADFGSGIKAFITGDWGVELTPEGEFPPEMQGLPPAEKFPCCDPETALKKLDESYKIAKEALKKLSEEEFRNKIVKAPWGEKGPMWAMLLSLLEHQINHKYQLFFYLKMLGLPVNTYTLYMGEE